MEVIHDGDWLYFYSGRHVHNPERPESEDAYSRTHVVRVADIKGIRIDDDNYEIDIFVAGHPFPIHAEFGHGGCYTHNAMGAVIGKLKVALGLNPEHLYGAHFTKRSPDVAGITSRQADIDDEIREAFPDKAEEILEIRQETEAIQKRTEEMRAKNLAEKKTDAEKLAALPEAVQARFLAVKNRLSDTSTPLTEEDTAEIKGLGEELRAIARGSATPASPTGVAS